MILQIQRRGTAYPGRAAPIELAIRSEPAADASAVPPPADKGGAVLAPPVHGTANPLTGGDSFNNAPEITSGATYSDTIVTGESRYFRIPMQWGQRFSYLLTPDGNPQPELSPGGYASVAVFNPVRQSIEMTEYDIGGEFWFNSGAPNSFSASTVYPARYTNRQEFRSRSDSLNGDYYLRLMAPLTDEASSEGYLLTVVVSGDVEAGPIYQVGDAGATTATSTGASTADTSSSASAENSPATADAGAALAAEHATPDDGQPNNNAWIYLAIAVVLLLTALVVLLVVRQKRPTNGPPTHS